MAYFRQEEDREMKTIADFNRAYYHRMYLDYLNDFLTVAKFAEYYCISVADANDIIKKGRVYHKEINGRFC